jgi:PAS domain-containing protein
MTGAVAVAPRKWALATTTEADLALIEEAASIALIAIERHRSQENLRRALYELQKSETNLRQVIDAIPTLVWCTRPDGSTVSVFRVTLDARLSVSTGVRSFLRWTPVECV